jgi:hypothetical protein
VIGYAGRAVPWRLVSAGCAAVSALMAIVAAWPKTMWPLQGTAIGLLAGVAAWSLDESAAAVVDTLPRPLWWRTAARASAAVPLAVTWAACVLVPRDRLPPHTALFLIQGFAALLFAIAFVTWRRAHQQAVPGTRFASVSIPVAAMLALVRPLPAQFPIFPVWPPEKWALSLAIWATLAACSAVALAGTLLDARGRALQTGGGKAGPSAVPTPRC